jgi:hypothetical protein
MRLHIVDVFAEARYEGNQLAVVRDCAGLSAETMQLPGPENESVVPLTEHVVLVVLNVTARPLELVALSVIHG